jgi:hypothetical protein
MIRVAALMPWFKAAREYKKFLNWCSNMVEERQKVFPSPSFTLSHVYIAFQRQIEKRDIFSWLLEAEPTNVGPLKAGIDVEARTAIIAGR